MSESVAVQSPSKVGSVKSSKSASAATSKSSSQDEGEERRTSLNSKSESSSRSSLSDLNKNSASHSDSGSADRTPSKVKRFDGIKSTSTSAKKSQRVEKSSISNTAEGKRSAGSEGHTEGSAQDRNGNVTPNSRRKAPTGNGSSDMSARKAATPQPIKKKDKRLGNDGSDKRALTPNIGHSSEERKGKNGDDHCDITKASSDKSLNRTSKSNHPGDSSVKTMIVFNSERKPLDEPLQRTDASRTRSTILYRYTHEELMELKNNPLSLQLPVFLCQNLEILESISAAAYEKRLAARGLLEDDLMDEGARRDLEGGGDGNKPRIKRAARELYQVPRDPSGGERVGGSGRGSDEEEDKIVLGPQRNSFTSGCQVTAGALRRNNNERPGRIGSGRLVPLERSDSAGGGKEFSSQRSVVEGRERREYVQGEARRPDRDFGRDYVRRDKDQWQEKDGRRDYRNMRGDQRRDFTRDDGRREYGREYERRRNADSDVWERGVTQDNNQRGYVDRRYGERRYDGGGRRGEGDDGRYYGRSYNQSEPEWFSGGPADQSETIELRGFEDDRLSVRSSNHTGSEYSPRIRPESLSELMQDSEERVNRKSEAFDDERELDAEKTLVEGGEDLAPPAHLFGSADPLNELDFNKILSMPPPQMPEFERGESKFQQMFSRGGITRQTSDHQTEYPGSGRLGMNSGAEAFGSGSMQPNSNVTGVGLVGGSVPVTAESLKSVEMNLKALLLSGDPNKQSSILSNLPSNKVPSMALTAEQLEAGLMVRSNAAAGPPAMFPQAAAAGPAPMFPQAAAAGPSVMFPQAAAAGPAPMFPQGAAAGQPSIFPQVAAAGPAAMFPQGAAAGPAAMFPQAAAAGPAAIRTQPAAANEEMPLAKNTTNQQQGGSLQFGGVKATLLSDLERPVKPPGDVSQTSVSVTPQQKSAADDLTAFNKLLGLVGNQSIPPPPPPSNPAAKAEPVHIEANPLQPDDLSKSNWSQPANMVYQKPPPAAAEAVQTSSTGVLPAAGAANAAANPVLVRPVYQSYPAPPPPPAEHALINQNFNSSPIMFCSQPPMNLTAPQPVHGGFRPPMPATSQVAVVNPVGTLMGNNMSLPSSGLPSQPQTTKPIAAVSGIKAAENSGKVSPAANFMPTAVLRKLAANRSAEELLSGSTPGTAAGSRSSADMLAAAAAPADDAISSAAINESLIPKLKARIQQATTTRREHLISLLSQPGITPQQQQEIQKQFQALPAFVGYQLQLVEQIRGCSSVTQVQALLKQLEAFSEPERQQQPQQQPQLLQIPQQALQQMMRTCPPPSFIPPAASTNQQPALNTLQQQKLLQLQMQILQQQQQQARQQYQAVPLPNIQQQQQQQQLIMLQQQIQQLQSAGYQDGNAALMARQPSTQQANLAANLPGRAIVKGGGQMPQLSQQQAQLLQQQLAAMGSTNPAALLQSQASSAATGGMQEGEGTNISRLLASLHGLVAGAPAGVVPGHKFKTLDEIEGSGQSEK